MNIFNPSIIGHEEIAAMFNDLFVQEKIPQAIIFNGIDGIGKDFFADEISKFYNTTNQSSHQRFSEPQLKYVMALPRGKNEVSHDDPYEKLEKQDFENVLSELELKKKNPYHKIKIERANQIKINSIRDVNKYLSISSNPLEHRMVLISHAELMNEESQNALLKNLEEPPERVTFILTTSNIENLRPTVISRCWMVKFSPLKAEAVVKILNQHFDVEFSRANIASLLSNGSVTEAVELIDNDLEYFQTSIIEFLRSALAGNIQTSNTILSQLLKSNDKKNFHLVVKLILFWLSDLKREIAGIGDYHFQSFYETIQKFNSRHSRVKLNAFISNAESLSNAVSFNNLNLNIATHKLIFELSALIKQNN